MSVLAPPPIPMRPADLPLPVPVVEQARPEPALGNDAPSATRWWDSSRVRMGFACFAIAATLVVGGLAAVGSFAPAAAHRHVVLFLTDAAVPLDAFNVQLAGATAGDGQEALAVTGDAFNLAALHGPSNARPVAAGDVGLDATGPVELVFQQAHAVRGGAQIPVDIPEARLVMTDALVAASGQSVGIILDVDLAHSLLEPSTGHIVFKPDVARLYRFTAQSPTSAIPEADLLEQVSGPHQARHAAAEPAASKTTCGGDCGTSAASSSGAPGSSGPGGGRIVRATASVPLDNQTGATPNVPSSPNPSDGSVGQSHDFVASWTGGASGSGTVKYLVQLGTTEPPSTVVCEPQANTQCAFGNLAASTTYYWRVVAAVDGGGTASGPVWSFATTGSLGLTSPPTAALLEKTGSAHPPGTSGLLHV